LTPSANILKRLGGCRKQQRCAGAAGIAVTARTVTQVTCASFARDEIDRSIRARLSSGLRRCQGVGDRFPVGQRGLQNIDRRLEGIDHRFVVADRLSELDDALQCSPEERAHIRGLELRLPRDRLGCAQESGPV